MKKQEKTLCVFLHLKSIECVVDCPDAIAVVGKCRITGRHVVRAKTPDNSILELRNKKWIRRQRWSLNGYTKRKTA